MGTKSRDVEKLLRAWGEGSPEALDELIPLILEDVRQIAARHLRGEPSAISLQATELVNEVYLRLRKLRQVRWANRAQLFAYLAEVVRRLLVERARKRLAEKRGAGAHQVPLEDELLPTRVSPEELLSIDELLDSLPERQHQVVELKLFVGLTEEEVADVLDLGRRTVSREWKKAKLYLLRELERTTAANGQEWEER